MTIGGAAHAQVVPNPATFALGFRETFRFGQTDVIILVGRSVQITHNHLFAIKKVLSIVHIGTVDLQGHAIVEEALDFSPREHFPAGNLGRTVRLFTGGSGPVAGFEIASRDAAMASAFFLATKPGWTRLGWGLLLTQAQ